MARRLISTVVAASVVVVAGAWAAGAGSSADASAPMTLVDGRPPIRALAQDGRRLAWIEDARPADRCGSGTVTFLETTLIGSGDVRRLPKTIDCSAAGYTLAVGGDRVLWSNWWYGNSTYSYVTTVAVGDRRDTALEGESTGLFADRSPADGDFLVEAAGNGRLLAYGGYHATPVDYDGCVEGTGDCRSTYTSWAKRVVGRRSTLVPHALGGQVAVADPLIAGVSYAREPSPAVVDVRNAFTGAVRSSFALRGIRAGEIRDLALAHRFVILLVHQGSSLRIDVYAVDSGTLVRQIPIHPRPRIVVSRISASDAAVVYASGSDVHAIDLRSFADRVVARAEPSPGQRLFLSIDGRRVVWAERSPEGGARIRAVDVR